MNNMVSAVRQVLLLPVVLCALSAPLSALTWDFADSRQGWAVVESRGRVTNNPLILENALVDGIWEIAANPFVKRPLDRDQDMLWSGVQLRSPRIGYDTELFDTIRIRLRQSLPLGFQVFFMMQWTNHGNRDEPGRRVIGIDKGAVSDEWEEWVISFPQHAAEFNQPWEGELIDFRLTLSWRGPLGDVGYRPLLEIDYITLTGVEEQLLDEPLPLPGEDLAPPPPPGRLLHLADYHPVRRDLGHVPRYPGPHSSATLMDVNRNGRLDLVCFWDSGRDQYLESQAEQGWVVALNDGDGAFAPRLEYSYGPSSYIFSLWSADLTGDGWPELIVDRGFHLEVSRFDAELNREVLLAVDRDEQRYLLGSGDVTGDGAAELIVQDLRRAYTVEAWSYLQDAFEPVTSFQWQRINLAPLTARRFAPQRLVEILWGARQAPWGNWVLSPVSSTGPEEDEHLVTDLSFTVRTLLGLGDLTGDGRIELIGAKERVDDYGLSVMQRGLLIWRDDGNGAMTATPWFDEHVTVNGLVWVGDLDGDGYEDVVFAHDNPARGYAVVVARGQAHGLPQVEGWYPLTGPGSQILAGDVTNDGYLDLVVVDNILGGVHVLKSRLAEEPITAVGETPAPRPTEVHLGPNYPNPFNPHTAIPFTLAAAGAVRLRVYDLRGRLVRTLWDGPLAAGAHRLDWDGRNAAGRPVASGVYLYRLEAGGQVHSRKLLKLE